jgi:hypothetical protein
MRLRVVVLSLALALTSSISARAEDKPEQNAAYAEAIRRAVQEYSLGHWSEARTFFASAHALLPSARTLRGLALASYELRSYVDAIDYFERALAETAQPLEGRLREEAQQFLKESRMFVTTIHVDLAPLHAQLKADGKPVQLTADKTLRLDPGSHTLSAEAEGYETDSQNVVTRGGEPLTVRLQLRASAPELAMSVSGSAVPGASSSARADHRDNNSDNDNGIGPWIVMGASAAVAITGGVFLGVAASSKSAAEDPVEKPSYQEIQDAASRGRTFFPLGFTLVSVGAAGLAAGLAWKYWPVFGSSERNASVSLTPTGFQLRGSF